MAVAKKSFKFYLSMYIFHSAVYPRVTVNVKCCITTSQHLSQLGTVLHLLIYIYMKTCFFTHTGVPGCMTATSKTSSSPLLNEWTGKANVTVHTFTPQAGCSGLFITDVLWPHGQQVSSHIWQPRKDSKKTNNKLVICPHRGKGGGGVSCPHRGGGGGGAA